MQARAPRAIDPLWRRAPARLLRGGPWAVLVAATFLLLAATAAAGPLAERAMQNTATVSTLAAVPVTAPATESAVLRLSGGDATSAAGQVALDDMRQIPGSEHAPPRCWPARSAGEVLPAVRWADGGPGGGWPLAG